MVFFGFFWFSERSLRAYTKYEYVVLANLEERKEGRKEGREV